MNPPQRITAFLKEWLELTQLEFHAIQMARAADLARVRKSKAGLRQSLSEAIDQWKGEHPAELAAVSFCRQITLLFDLESNDSDLLAVRKRQVREKLLLLEQALDHFCRLRTDRSQTSAAA